MPLPVDRLVRVRTCSGRLADVTAARVWTGTGLGLELELEKGGGIDCQGDNNSTSRLGVPQGRRGLQRWQVSGSLEERRAGRRADGRRRYGRKMDDDQDSLAQVDEQVYE
jgi:hypothetical protein